MADKMYWAAKCMRCRSAPNFHEACGPKDAVVAAATGWHPERQQWKPLVD